MSADPHTLSDALPVLSRRALPQELRERVLEEIAEQVERERAAALDSAREGLADNAGAEGPDEVEVARRVDGAPPEALGGAGPVRDQGLSGQKAITIPAAPLPKAKEVDEGPLQDLDGGLAVIDELLRHRGRLLRRIEEGRESLLIARSMLLTIVVCTMAIGASIGFFRGGVQVAFAAIKLPMVLLLTAAICAPVYTTLKAALQHKASLVADFALILCAVALACLVSVSLCPLLMLAALRETGYHAFVLLSAGLCLLGGLAGYVFFFQGMHQQLRRGYRLVTIALLFVLAMVSTQMTWIARPYVVRPASDEVPFLRDYEGSFLEAIRKSVDSARGIYDAVGTIDEEELYP